jgi:hypothetical protein
MTATQVSMIDRALTRAHTSGLHIIGKGTVRADGTCVFAVSSASDAVLAHLVTVQGNRLHCDCTAAQYDRYCAHRALVHEVLSQEAQQVRPSHETAVLMPARGNAAISMWK